MRTSVRVLGFLTLGASFNLLAATLTQDSFDGSAGAAPDSSRFTWSGQTEQNGAGQLSLSTVTADQAWLRSQAGGTPDTNSVLILKMHAYAYAENPAPWAPHGVYGDGQPRGLRVGADANNAIEFYSAANTSIGMRVRKDGNESSATYSAAVDVMRDYEIMVTTTSAVFKVDGVVAGTFSTNIPSGALSVYVSTWDGGGVGNVPVVLDSLQLSLADALTNPADYSWSTNGDAITIVSYNGTNTVVSVPEFINGLPVKQIGFGAFSGRSNLSGVSLPDSVTNIAERVFFYCENLASVHLPAGLVRLGGQAFGNCRRLTNVVLPSTVRDVGVGAFSACSGLPAISVSADNPVYCDVSGVLMDRRQSSVIVCPAGKAGAFTIPATATNIQDLAFADCSGLTAVSIPPGMRTIGYGAFRGCSSLAAVTIPNEITAIADSTFAYCSSLTSVAIGTSVLSLGDSTFANCTSLSTLVIPDNVISISRNTFFYCIQLSSVTFSTNINAIFDSAFASCSSLTSITIPDKVADIRRGTFDACTSLASVTLGKAVSSLADDAFEDCVRLTQFSVSPRNQNYSAVDGILLNKNASKLVKFPPGLGGSPAIPTTVTQIGYQAFYRCYNLTSVTIPDSVGQIGSWAFVACTNLASITVPGSVTNIGYLGFAYCGPRLKSVLFTGDAPDLGSSGDNLLDGNSAASVYYLPGTTGWGDIFGGRPAWLWNPQMTGGVNAAGYGFTITGSSNLLLVIEASADLAPNSWVPVRTNTLTGGTSEFNDPEWTGRPHRFYRLRTP